MTVDPTGDLAAAAETVCMAEDEHGYLCTEWPNHDGWHRVELDGEVLNTWPNEEGEI
jgi:hypothetical protein